VANTIFYIMWFDMSGGITQDLPHQRRAHRPIHKRVNVIVW